MAARRILAAAELGGVAKGTFDGFSGRGRDTCVGRMSRMGQTETIEVRYGKFAALPLPMQNDTAIRIGALVAETRSIGRGTQPERIQYQYDRAHQPPPMVSPGSAAKARW